jgi:hypothetical protein
MALEVPRDKWGKTYDDVLDEFLRKRGVIKYVAFDQTGEGLPLSSGFETSSFLVLTPDGKLWDIFLDWDPEAMNPDGEKGYYKLREPRERTVEESDSLWRDPSYLRARKQLNLPLTEEQEQILKDWEEEQKKYQT